MGAARLAFRYYGSAPQPCGTLPHRSDWTAQGTHVQTSARIATLPYASQSYAMQTTSKHISTRLCRPLENCKTGFTVCGTQHVPLARFNILHPQKIPQESSVRGLSIDRLTGPQRHTSTRVLREQTEHWRTSHACT